jgi:aspartokinase
MLALSAHGAKVLQARSVELAMRYGVRVRVLSSFAESAGTVIEGRAVCSDLRGHSDFSGASADLCGRSNLSTSAASVNNTTPAPLPSGHPRTNITSNRGIPMEKLIVTGITSKHNIVKVDVVIKRADAIRDVLRDVSNAGIRLEFLSQSEFVCDKSLEKCAMFTFITEAQYADVLHGATFSDDVLDVTLTRDVAEVSVIGLGFDEHTLLAVLNACAEHNIQLTLLTASNQIISFITAMQNVDVAILSIHSAFFADTEVQ